MMSEPTSPLPYTDLEGLFELTPMSLWLEDYSQVKTLMDNWRAMGVTDLQAHLRADPLRLDQCIQAIRIVRVNQKTLQLFGASNQHELVQRMDEVMRDASHHGLQRELQQLWNGKLAFSNQSVNYTLDGKRINIRIHVRVLPGHEDTWDKVLVSLDDITATTQAHEQLHYSEQHGRNLFDLSPVSLWVEDFSSVKDALEEVRASGIHDFRTFLDVHPDFVVRCMEKIRVLDVNQHTLHMFGARDKQDLLHRLDEIFRDEMRASFTHQLMDLWNGKIHQVREVVNYSLTGDPINIHLQFAVMPGHEEHWDMVLVSLVDITARKKAEAYLEYLGKHDALTRLRNRAYYVEELNRISRRGPWPVSIVAMDMNDLKTINDTQGHAAGDALLRRMGEVLAKASEGLSHVCVARTGGDEFVALMPGSDERAAQAFQERLGSILDLNNQFYPGQKLSLSVGTASCSGPSEVESAIHKADQRMFDAKRRYYADHQLTRRNDSA
ncbi:diguanylate cyclase [Curvibacter sp. CHRR-16]|uniref:sensor domain-containing diguanylate cyclase n=1 Tax=Curvibacter sp. CHRR-16 TaxID=2835872 RepID=UPI001BD9E841|nr:diguanylate cyclase [Curvibacter sp. CHRR-16]MBT0568820.1 diguanylate cyclase [Curvibacter sp. CHRR-16]